MNYGRNEYNDNDNNIAQDIIWLCFLFQSNYVIGLIPNDGIQKQLERKSQKKSRREKKQCDEECRKRNKDGRDDKKKQQ